VQKWQARTKNNPDLSYEMRPKGEGRPRVRVRRETDYRIGEIVPWVAVEKYLFGQVVDMGGTQKANVHLKLERGGKTLLVGASQGYLREQVENRLYRPASIEGAHFFRKDSFSVFGIKPPRAVGSLEAAEKSGTIPNRRMAG